MNNITPEYGLLRYEKQILIDDFGENGQKSLKKAKVIIAGIGGLGSSISIYLAAAGTGTIRLIDHDQVTTSNLNRQILHWNKDIGRNKTDSAKEKLVSLNPEVKIEDINELITESNVFELTDGCDLIIDAADNLNTRYLLNKVAVKRNIPLFHGTVRGFEGRVTTVIPGKTPCLKCLYRQALTPEISPVIGVTPAIIGIIQATEVIKYIAGIGKLLTNRLLIYDGLSMEFMEIKVKRHPDCDECQHLTCD